MCRAKVINEDVKERKSYLNLFDGIDSVKLNFSLDKYQVLYKPDSHGSNEINSPYYLLNFINTDCGSCYRRMEDWEAYINRRELATPVVFVASGSINEYFTRFLSSHRNLPFWIVSDLKAEMLFRSGLYRYDKESVLINSNGRVRMIGNPITNEVIEKYIKEVVNEE